MHHAVLRLAELCGDVVVVIGPATPEPPMPPGAPVRFARDAAEHRGPLAGAYAGLLATRSTHAVLAGGDMPELQIPVLRKMLRVAAEAPCEAVALDDGGRARPLPCVVRVERARTLARGLLDDERRRLRDLLDAMQVAVIEEATWTALDPERRTLLDIDEPSDL